MQVRPPNIAHYFNGYARFAFDPVVPPGPGDWVVGKGPGMTDAFSNPHLRSFLEGMGIEKIYVCGFMRGFCVHDTAVSAKQAGWPVTMIKDLSADSNDGTDPDGQDISRSGGNIENLDGLLLSMRPVTPIP